MRCSGTSPGRWRAGCALTMRGSTQRCWCTGATASALRTGHGGSSTRSARWWRRPGCWRDDAGGCWTPRSWRMRSPPRTRSSSWSPRSAGSAGLSRQLVRSRLARTTTTSRASPCAPGRTPGQAGAGHRAGQRCAGGVGGGGGCRACRRAGRGGGAARAGCRPGCGGGRAAGDLADRPQGCQGSGALHRRPSGAPYPQDQRAQARRRQGPRRGRAGVRAVHRVCADRGQRPRRANRRRAGGRRGARLGGAG